ncbi:hypothetical protein INR49_017021 [Caranx melampygus]|nr:hypothetical protein INR49_017021 [Caranx melampygus]
MIVTCLIAAVLTAEDDRPLQMWWVKKAMVRAWTCCFYNQSSDRDALVDPDPDTRNEKVGGSDGGDVPSGSLNVKDCSKLVTIRKSSIFASCSPMHTLRPEGTVGPLLSKPPLDERRDEEATEVADDGPRLGTWRDICKVSSFLIKTNNGFLRQAGGQVMGQLYEHGTAVWTFLSRKLNSGFHQVLEVSTQEMGVCNGKTSTRNKPQNSLDFCLGVSVELVENRKFHGSGLLH